MLIPIARVDNTQGTMDVSADIKACERIATNELRSKQTRSDFWLKATDEANGDEALAEQLYILKRVVQISEIVVSPPRNPTTQDRSDLREYEQQLNHADPAAEHALAVEQARNPWVTEKQKPLLHILLGLLVALQPFVLFPIGRAELTLGMWDIALFIWVLALALIVIGVRKLSRRSR